MAAVGVVEADEPSVAYTVTVTTFCPRAKRERNRRAGMSVGFIFAKWRETKYSVYEQRKRRDGKWIQREREYTTFRDGAYRSLYRRVSKRSTWAVTLACPALIVFHLFGTTNED